MDGIENIHTSQTAKMGKVEQTPAKEDLTKAFVAAFKQADAMASQVTDAQKKEREEDQKRRGRNLKKDDYENKDEIDEILEEIDKRLEQMLEVAKRLDG